MRLGAVCGLIILIFFVSTLLRPRTLRFSDHIPVRFSLLGSVSNVATAADWTYYKLSHGPLSFKIRAMFAAPKEGQRTWVFLGRLPNKKGEWESEYQEYLRFAW
jgi:hypothetical protein